MLLKASKGVCGIYQCRGVIFSKYMCATHYNKMLQTGNVMDTTKVSEFITTPRERQAIKEQVNEKNAISTCCAVSSGVKHGVHSPS